MITANRFLKCPFEVFKHIPKVGFIARMAALDLPLTMEVDETASLQPYVNRGRWLVRCECGGCEYAWEEELFMCQSCWNSAHKHKLRRATFPALRAKVEAALGRRPLVNRNWSRGETIEFLERENTDHASELLEVS